MSGKDCARAARVRMTSGGKTDEILFKSINSVLLRFSYLSPATGINIFDLSLSELT